MQKKFRAIGIKIFSMLLGFVFFMCTLIARSQSSTPNIILILGDDIGYEIPTCNGGQSYETPNLDLMAAEGMRFTQCHATPLCSPSRFSLLTGKYNFRNYTEWGRMRPNQITLGNIFRDAGYQTACFGKWQLDGGDSGIHSLGFNQYCVWAPGVDYEGADSTAVAGNNIYKSPRIFTNGRFVSSSLTAGKYGEDIFADSVKNFIAKNKTRPFFIYYPMVLGHSPESPTPDDPEYVSWDPAHPADISFFPSMVKYMDKKIGEIIDMVKSQGIEENTIIIFAGDNGTNRKINSIYNNQSIDGGKATTTVEGTHVPLLIYNKGNITAGTINNDLIEFTDFFPSLAEMAHIAMPENIGTVDGVSFANRLSNGTGNPRDWIFFHYQPNILIYENTAKIIRWAQTSNYKLYDTNYLKPNFEFYNIVNDILEQYPLNDSSLTSKEDSIKNQLFQVMDHYRLQAASIPIVSSPYFSALTDSSAMLGASVIADNNFSVFEKGIVYNTIPDVRATDSSLEAISANTANFSVTKNSLKPQNKYYYKGYALNDNGTGLSKVDSFYTLSKPVLLQPVSFTATPSFGAIKLNWSQAQFPSPGAKKAGYLLICSEVAPMLRDVANGLQPDSIIQVGSIIFNTNSTLPKLPAKTFTKSGLTAGVTYHFLLIPYTWDGKNNGTYNYAIQGAKRVIATVSVPPNPVINNISPKTAGFVDKAVISVSGTGYNNNLSSVFFNGIQLPSTYINNNKLNAVISANLLMDTGSGNITVRTTGAINESNSKKLTIQASTIPALLVDTSNLNSFQQICLNTISAPKSFMITGASLDGSNIIIGPLEGYVFSRSADSGYNDSIIIGGYGQSFSSNIYIKFFPQVEKDYTGLVSIMGGGSVKKLIGVFGSGISNPTQLSTNPIASGITQNKAIITGKLIKGCPSIAAYGMVYGYNENLLNSTMLPASNLLDTTFSVELSGLLPGTKYYYRAYAIRANDTVYGSTESFVTSKLGVTEANPANSVFQTRFTANWTTVADANDYRLDVDTTNDFRFGIITGWDFPETPDNALVDNAIAINNMRTISIVGAKDLSFALSGVTTNAASATGWNNGIGTKWWQIDFDATGYYDLRISSKQQSSYNGPGDFKLQYRIGLTGNWLDVKDAAISVSTNFNKGVLDNILLPEICNNQPSVYLRWVVTSTRSANNGTVQGAGSNKIDDLLIKGSTSIPGYGNLTVNGSSKIVTGLLPNTNYYYRLRAVSPNSVSNNSNIITVKTLATLSASLNIDTGTICDMNNGGSVTISGNGGAPIYTYSIDGGANYFLNGKFENLPPGNYTAILKDATNTKTEKAFTIEEPVGRLVQVNHTDNLCFGGADGNITLKVEGLDTFYYSIGIDSNTTGIFNNLKSGNYDFMITNNNGCLIDSGAIILSDPPTLSISEIHTPIIMPGEMSTVTISATGGTGSYTGTGTFTQYAGTQIYTVTDANGCQATIEVTVIEPVTLFSKN